MTPTLKQDEWFRTMRTMLVLCESQGFLATLEKVKKLILFMDRASTIVERMDKAKTPMPLDIAKAIRARKNVMIHEMRLSYRIELHELNLKGST